MTPPTVVYKKLNFKSTTLLGLPRELRDSVYDYIISNIDLDAYNDCGLGIVLEHGTLLRVCKQIASEFMTALFRQTRVGLQSNLDDISLSTVTDLVRNRVRLQARFLAIDVKSVRNINLHGAPQDTNPRQHLTRILTDAVKAFPKVYDFAIWICIKDIADGELKRIVAHELEQLSTVKTYRIFTHKSPGWRSRLRSEDSVRGESTLTWMERISDDKETLWKPRVIADGQWSTETPVWWIYGSTSRSCSFGDF
jgi:hypothetical protein